MVQAKCSCGRRAIPDKGAVSIMRFHGPYQATSVVSDLSDFLRL